MGPSFTEEKKWENDAFEGMWWERADFPLALERRVCSGKGAKMAGLNAGAQEICSPTRKKRSSINKIIGKWDGLLERGERLCFKHASDQEEQTAGTAEQMESKTPSKFHGRSALGARTQEREAKEGKDRSTCSGT